MAEIETIVALLKENNLKLEGLNTSFMALHSDLTTFKGEVSTALTDTNGKLKGNNEVLTLKIDQLSKDLKNITSNLGDQIQINHDDILRNKNTIANLYELDRAATKRNDDAHTELIKGLDEKMSNCSSDSGAEMKEIRDIAKDSQTKINILFGISGGLGLAVIAGLIDFFTK